MYRRRQFIVAKQKKYIFEGWKQTGYIGLRGGGGGGGGGWRGQKRSDIFPNDEQQKNEIPHLYNALISSNLSDIFEG